MSRPDVSERFKEVFTEIVNERLDKELENAPEAEITPEFSARMQALIRKNTERRKGQPVRRALLIAAALSALALLSAFVIVPGIKKAALTGPYHVHFYASDDGAQPMDEEYGFIEVPAGFTAKKPVRAQGVLQQEYTDADGACIILTQFASEDRKPTSGYKALKLTDAEGESLKVYASLGGDPSDAFWQKNGYLLDLHTVGLVLDQNALAELIGRIGLRTEE